MSINCIDKQKYIIWVRPLHSKNWKASTILRIFRPDVLPPVPTAGIFFYTCFFGFFWNKLWKQPIHRSQLQQLFPFLPQFKVFYPL